jgi:hypothetical protein
MFSSIHEDAHFPPYLVGGKSRHGWGWNAAGRLPYLAAAAGEGLHRGHSMPAG